MDIAILVSSLLMGFVLSIYAGVIVARYMSFDGAINSARSIVFNLEQVWEFRYLENGIPDPESPSERRTVFMSKVIASNQISWRLTECGLELKELGHWKAGLELDKIGMEIDALRDDFTEKAQLTPGGSSLGVTEHIADWHRRISSLVPVFWQIIKLWPNSRYKHMSCIHIDEATGDWHEVEAKQPKTVFDDPNYTT